MAAELTRSRSSYPAWVTISSWSLSFNLLLNGILLLVGGWLGLFLTGPLMVLAAWTGLAGAIMSKDSYRAGRTQGAILGVLWNTWLTLWPALSFLSWLLKP